MDSSSRARYNDGRFTSGQNYDDKLDQQSIGNDLLDPYAKQPTSGYQSAQRNASTGPTNPTDAFRNSQFTLTKEDLLLLNECNSESFYYRSLPGMITAGSACYFANTQRPFNRFKLAMFSSIALGWLIGKISYRTKCTEKFLHAKHNSALVESIRKNNGYKKSELDDDDVGFGEVNTSSNDPQGKWGPGMEDGFKRDTYASSANWKNDSYLQPDSDLNEGDTGTEQKPRVTYEELRNLNRSKYSAAGYPVSQSPSS